MIGKRLLTLSETAEILNIKYWRAAELARQNLIPVVHLGRSKRVDPDRLQEWINSGGKALPGGWKQEAQDGRPALPGGWRRGPEERVLA